MNARTPKLIPANWQKLIMLGQKQGSIKLQDLAQEIGLQTAEALNLIRELFPEGQGVEVYHQEQEYWVDIDAEALQYMLPLSPGEWNELQQLLQFAETHMPHGESFKTLKRKVIDNGPVRFMMDLLTRLDHPDQQLTEIQQSLLILLERAMLDKKRLHLESHEGKNFHLHPLKILHLEGQLSLIAEDTQDHCLMVIPVLQIKQLEVLDAGQPRVTTYEIEEFITAIRAMNEKEARLILKIYDPQSVNLFPNHHFLGKPCMITNPQGDLIWAAYVEPCHALFDWLMSLGTNVEILDPISFKDDYLSYCKEKLQKIA